MPNPSPASIVENIPPPSVGKLNLRLCPTALPMRRLSEALDAAGVMGCEQPAEADSSPPEPIIAFSHVGISFDGRAVLEDLSFQMNRGQTLCILGRSGVGKSVALRMLMGFLKPDEGSILIEGQEITTLSEEGLRAIRKRVTMVFQNGALFDSLSVRENVAFPLRERGGLNEEQIHEKVDQLINVVGAEDVANAFPASLSTGRKRAVAMARALAAEPEWSSTTSRPPWSIPSLPAVSATSLRFSRSILARPASWLRTTCASPSGSPIWFSSSIRGGPIFLVRSRAFSRLPIRTFSNSLLWMLTYYLRAEALAFRNRGSEDFACRANPL